MIQDTIKIKELIGKNAISMEQGNSLYEKLSPLFLKYSNNKDYQLTLDFEDVNVISTPFFNSSISYLLKDYSIQECQKRLIFLNLREDSKALLNYSLHNAVIFYKNK